MTPAPNLSSLPQDFKHSLVAVPLAANRFAALPPSHQREYLKYIEEAKKPETRGRRIAQMVVRLEQEALAASS